MSRSVNVSTCIDVDIDLGEIRTNDLVSELRSRDVDVGEDLNDMTEMFYAFKLGNINRAIELAKKIACDHTGGIL